MDSYPKTITISNVDYTVTSKEHEAATRKDPTTGTVAPEFQEYPKVIHVGGGTFTVKDAKEEAQYRKGTPEPVKIEGATHGVFEPDASEDLPESDDVDESTPDAPAKKKTTPKLGDKKK